MSRDAKGQRYNREEDKSGVKWRHWCQGTHMFWWAFTPQSGEGIDVVVYLIEVLKLPAEVEWYEEQIK